MSRSASATTDLEGGGDHVELVPIGSLADPVGGVPRCRKADTPEDIEQIYLDAVIRRVSD